MHDTHPVSSLEDHAGYWLRFVSNHVSHAFARKVDACGVTVAEWVLMRTLFDAGEANPSQLADTMGMTRGAVSKLVRRLEDKRLLRCRDERADKRYLTVALTPAGRRMVPTLARLADDNDAAFFGHLDDRQRAALIALLRDIVTRHALGNVPVD